MTAAPSCPVQADPWHAQVGLLLQKRDTSYCVPNSKIFCYQPAACVSVSDGYVGCCTAIGTTCEPRTRCIDYTLGITTSCDYVTGGCVYCSNPSRPFCIKAYRDNNYIFSCGTEQLTTTYADTETADSISGSATPSASPTIDSQPTETSASDNLPAFSSPSTLLSVSSASSLSSSTTSPSSSTTMNTTTPTSAQSGSVGSSRKLIIGVILGAAAGSILLLVLLFVGWKFWKRRRSGAGGVSYEKSSKAGYSLGSGEDSMAEHNSSQRGMTSELSNVQGPAELEEQSHRSADGNFESTSAHNAANRHPYSPEDIRGAAEAPSDAPVHFSPSIAMTSPTPSNSSLWMTTPGMGTPRAPSRYVAYTPSSAYSASGQPPSSLPQPGYRDINTAFGSSLAELEAHEVGRSQ
ncbi:hypothetical protein KCU62_g1356, partial [Aureobasidium sp. EXF-3399]